MTSVKQALHAFWGRFVLGETCIHAYGEDTLPPEENISFPYIIFRTDIPDAFVTLETGATVWFDANDAGANQQRAALCDEIAKAMPIQGVRLPLSTGGHIVIRRSTGAFLSDYTPGDPNTAIGARVGYTITTYSML